MCGNDKQEAFHSCHSVVIRGIRDPRSFSFWLRLRRATLFSFLKQLARDFYKAAREEDRVHLCALLVILLLTIGLRLFFLFQPMRYDEANTFIQYASKPLYVRPSDYSLPNNHLFHTFLVHTAYLLLGNKPWVIRLPALIAGILLAPASYCGDSQILQQTCCASHCWHYRILLVTH